MIDETKLKQAQATFLTLCQALDDNEWPFEKDEENLCIECGARGDDIPMNLSVRVDAKRQLVLLLSKLPFTVPEDKRIDIAVAISSINYILVDGSFDYSVTSGNIVFRMTNSFMESQLSKDSFEYMLYCSCKIIDEYNDKLLMLIKGAISLEQFVAKNN